MRIAVIAFAITHLAAACSRGSTSTTATPRTVSGTYIASLALTGRSTYTGTIELTPNPTARDSVRGTMVLTSPVRVDAPVAGVVRGDSLHLAGTYSAANGCTGTISLSFSLTTMPHSGPSKLVDRCVGAIDATFTARR